LNEFMRGVRVALLAGGLSQGGAEKQLVYMAGALLRAGAEVRVYCLTRGDHYEGALRSLGISPVWIGRFGNPAARVVGLAAALRGFRPHILQSTHFFSNLYVCLVAPLYRAVAIGSIRSDVYQEMKANGRWGPLLLRLPPAIIANSFTARRNAERLGIPPVRIEVLPNVLDLAEFDRGADPAPPFPREGRSPVVIAVCRLVAAKRLDRFLRALALARREMPGIRGVIVGEGPEGDQLASLARELSLLPDAVSFHGRRDDVAGLLRGSDIAVLTSEHEGFPNVVLEAMAARLPVVTTPSGDSGVIVEEGVTGFVVGGDDIEGIARRILTLSASPGLRRTFGEAGREKVERLYSAPALGGMLLSTYRSIAGRLGHKHLAGILSVNETLQERVLA
jgi:glycosyltransferase involved in cell wall biosynthesis